jgi:hypothetical protein
MNTKQPVTGEGTAPRVEDPAETIKALKGVLSDIIALARDPAGSSFTLREALNQYEFKAAIKWIEELA